MSEILTIHVGQAGVQIGKEVTELICLEHGITEDVSDKIPIEGENIDVFFKTTPKGNHVFRSIYVDLEPSVIDEIRKGRHAQLFHPNNLISGREDAASNFARGFYGVHHLNSCDDREIIDVVIDRIRKTVEECNNLQGFLIFNGLGGGTGSGYGSHLLKCLTDNFSQTVLEMSVVPSSCMCTASVDIYNTVLAVHEKMRLADCSVMFHNEVLYRLCTQNLGVYYPSYSNLNRLISHVVSSVTSSHRFPGNECSRLTDIPTNLVPYPRLNFATASFAPLMPKDNVKFEKFEVAEITRACFDSKTQFLNYDSENGRYLGCCMSYRGDIPPYDIHQAKMKVISNTKINDFIQWCLPGFKPSISCRKPIVTSSDDIAAFPRTASLLFNSTGFGSFWEQIIHKFDLMFDKRAFVHWYMGEGLEEGEFTEAREDIIQLQEEYRTASAESFAVPKPA